MIRVSRGADAEVRLESADVRMEGTRARVAIPGAQLELAVPLLGDFNLENVLVACGVAVALGVAPEAIEAGVAACPQVPGRVERVDGWKRRGADRAGRLRAHARRGRQAAAHAAPAHPRPADHGLRLRRRPRPRQAPADGRGGRALERPARSRPATTRAARIRARSWPTWRPGSASSSASSRKRWAPRSTPTRCVVDRRAAIGLAIGLARPDDTVVLAGKGHEDYQIVGRERLPFDDREEGAPRARPAGRAMSAQLRAGDAAAWSGGVLRQGSPATRAEGRLDRYAHARPRASSSSRSPARTTTRTAFSPGPRTPARAVC